ncbi:exo-alpha-sialidase [Spirosoma litoris]
MQPKHLFITSWLLAFLLEIAPPLYAQKPDQRDISQGFSIYENGYIDQPYVTVLPNGNWLGVFTTGTGKESMPGQHVVATTSTDQGRSWSPVVDVEPSSGPLASWGMQYLTPYGRLYVFYDYNGDNISTLNGKPLRTAGELGWYCYKYSDDFGKTWSERYRLPVRKTPVDLNNDWKGEVQMLWGISKPISVKGAMYFGFTKMGKFQMDLGEGWFFKSDNIDTEKDPTKLHWQMLPDGEQGLRSPTLGSIQEEHNLVSLNNGDLYCMYRTTQGFPAHAYSRDGGRSWTMPEAATYTPGGQIMKNPRACPRVFRCQNGKFLFWFHNHSGKTWEGRNPVWISGGIEKDGRIHWSQPEILLYTTDLSALGMSYPDLVEQDGHYWMTETQKSKARTHAINKALLDGLWAQATAHALTTDGLITTKKRIKARQLMDMPALPSLKEGGFSLDAWLTLTDLQPNQVVFDSRDQQGKGIWISTTDQQTLRLFLSDGTRTDSWDTDPGLIQPGRKQHVVFVVDGAPDIISVLIDGRLCDGGTSRQYGWGRFSPELTNINGSNKAVMAPSLHGQLHSLKLYNRYLTTSEAISNFNAEQIH